VASGIKSPRRVFLILEMKMKVFKKPSIIEKQAESRRLPAVFVPLCNCITPPWEDCEHTEELAMNELKTCYGIDHKENLSLWEN
jgi:hypothetical protein